MKTLGLLGGMSWESTVPYYRIINRTVNEHLGGLHSAEILLYSVDFQQIEEMQMAGRWSEASELLTSGARRLEKAGADLLVLCTNTMHKVAEQIEQAVSIPLLHIADATASVLRSAGVTSVGLLGTRFTMEQAFYRERLEQQGIRVLIPEESQRERVHGVIYDELCLGQIRDDSRQVYLDIVASLAERGARGVILGCTEIGLLIQAADTEVALYDTTRIHAEQAVRVALADKPAD